jgi:hypothetical protein
MADEKKKAPKTTAKAAPAADLPAEERCTVDKCKQPLRAKGYCRKHYIGWRRGKVGKKHRYNTCSKEGCRKEAVFAGKCDEHKKGGAPAGEAPAAG